MNLAEEERYEGDWANDAMNGQGKAVIEELGTYYYLNDDVYIGEWKNNARDGEGDFTDQRSRSHQLFQRREV